MSIQKKMVNMPGTEITLLFLGLLNLITVCFVALLPALTQYRAAREGALDFLETLKMVPIAPAMRIFLALGLYTLIVLCMMLKKGFYHKEDHGFFWLSYLEIILVAALMLILDMAYSGIIFLVVAEFLYYMGNRKNWAGFMIISFIIYLFCNYDLVTLVIPFNAFESWAAYYDGDTRAMLIGIKTLCELMNIMATMVFVALLILQDKREKQEIQVLNAQLKEVNAQLHEYALKQEEMGETKERNRLAREIHDTLGHILTGISMGVEAVQVLMDIAPDAARDQLTTIGDMARNGLNDVRRSVRKLKPDALETKSIDIAIQDMVTEISKTTGCKIYFLSNGSGLYFEAEEKETIYRMVQEGTTNALRHGKATEIWIRLDKVEDNVEISIDDNGTGNPAFEESFGLSHMRERVEILGGNISFISDNGFHIHAAIPVRKES